ncbi:hypothetical protein GGC47_004621 [Bosea sp. OAE752]|uniref:hypothetical protein n=1 Tax=Bosea sp. OAE752 TaxID=2663873 RepID=UPI003D1B4243
MIQAIASNLETLETSIERFRFGQMTGDRLVDVVRYNVWAVLETAEDTFDLKQAGNELVAAVEAMVGVMRPFFPSLTKDDRSATAATTLTTFLDLARKAQARQRAVI